MYKIIDNKLHKLVGVLDEEDFRVNSEGWEISSKNNALLISPCGGIVEARDGENKGKQFFIKSAMIRELNKAGKVLANRDDLISGREYGNYTDGHYYLGSDGFFTSYSGYITHLNKELAHNNRAHYYNNSTSLYKNEGDFVYETDNYYFAVRCTSYNL